MHTKTIKYARTSLSTFNGTFHIEIQYENEEVQYLHVMRENIIEHLFQDE